MFSNISECQWCNFLHMEEFSDTPLLSTHFYIRCHFIPLLPSVTGQQNVVEYWWEGSASTATSPTSTSNIVSQRNKIWGTTLRAALIDIFLFLRKTCLGCWCASHHFFFSTRLEALRVLGADPLFWLTLLHTNWGSFICESLLRSNPSLTGF